MIVFQRLSSIHQAIVIRQPLEDFWVHYRGRSKISTVEMDIGRSTTRIWSTYVGYLHYELGYPLWWLLALWDGYISARAILLQNRNKYNNKGKKSKIRYPCHVFRTWSVWFLGVFFLFSIYKRDKKQVFGSPSGG